MVNTYLNTQKNIFADLVSYAIYSAQLVSDLYVKLNMTKTQNEICRTTMNTFGKFLHFTGVKTSNMFVTLENLHNNVTVRVWVSIRY